MPALSPVPDVESSWEKRRVSLGDFAPGTRLGDYTVLATLGRGGMGVVYEARDERRGLTVALKVVRPELLAEPGLVERFQREADAMRRLRHPGIVAIHDVVTLPQARFLVLERVAGGTLQQRVKREGPLPWPEAAQIGAEIARALGVVHEAGLVHRDVKPQNILLGPEPKLSDFGLSRSNGAGPGSLTATGEIVGTFEYLAPEQAEAGKTVDARTDLYALGGTLFTLLTGSPPFKGQGYALVRSHLSETPPSVRSQAPATPPELDRLVARLLSKDPAARGASANAVALELAAIASGKTSRRRRRLPALAVVGVLLLAAMTLSRHGAPPAPPPPSLPRAPLPAPDPALTPRWALGATPHAELRPGSLWERGGRTAAPLRGVRDPDLRDALADAFLGRTTRTEGGRVVVAYDPRRAARLHPRGSFSFFMRANGTSLWPLEGGPNELVVDAPNDAGGFDVRIGDARWEAPRVSFGSRAEYVDMTTFTVSVGEDAQGSGARTLTLDGREQYATTGRRNVAYRKPLVAHPVTFAPGAAAGSRVLLDGRCVEPLDADSALGPAPGGLAFTFNEGRFTIDDLAVEGRPVRPDVPATATAPVSLGFWARVLASFSCEKEGSGGPFVALGAAGEDRVSLELDGSVLRLRHGEALLASIEVPGPRPARGWLALERRGPSLEAIAAVGTETRTISLVEPLPLAAKSVRASYGSTAPRVTFEEVLVHGGPEPSPASAFDLLAATGHLDEADQVLAHSEALVTAESKWRFAALALARVSDPRWAEPSLVGPPQLGERRQTARRAEQLLAEAAPGLPLPARKDALARMILADVVAGEPDRAHAAALQLVELEPQATARARVDALERELGQPVLVKRLLAGYGGFSYEGTDETGVAARDAVLVLADDRVAEIARLDALDAKRRKNFAGALAALERARASGYEPRVVIEDDMGDLVGEPPRALEYYRRALVLDPGNRSVWDKVAKIENSLGHIEAIEAALASFACWSARPGARDALIRFGSVAEDRGHVGLAAACLLAILETDDAPRDDMRTHALALARRAVAPPPSPDRIRDGLLAAYVAQACGDPFPLDPLDRSTAPLTKLRRARLIVDAHDEAGARAVLREAIHEDPFVHALARLDPVLSLLLDR
jgi:serine/threonine-protein kinase